jgi:hypothetical protein
MNHLMLDYLWLRAYAESLEARNPAHRESAWSAFQPTFLSIR